MVHASFGAPSMRAWHLNRTHAHLIDETRHECSSMRPTMVAVLSFMPMGRFQLSVKTRSLASLDTLLSVYYELNREVEVGWFMSSGVIMTTSPLSLSVTSSATRVGILTS